MSGRVRWQREGETVVGHRKTDRRNARRDPRERLRDVARAAGPDAYPVRMAFRLPKSLEGFVAPGAHGLGVQVLAGGFVRIGAGSSEQCFVKAQEFCAVVACERPAFSCEVVLIHHDAPHETCIRYLSVVRGAAVISSATLEPRIYEAA